MDYSIAINGKKNWVLNPVQFGHENCDKCHFFGPIILKHWLIHFVVSGFGIFKIRDKEYTVKAGEMFVIPPYVETYYEADAVNPWSYIWIGFTCNVKELEMLSDVIVCPEAEKIFTSIKETTGYPHDKHAYLTARLWDLFALLLEEDSIKYDYTEKALSFIHANYMYNISVEKIAQDLNLDRTYFSYIFKKKTGLSPKQYILNYRMNVAAAIITKNCDTISVVANSVGYSDLYTFSKVFKRHFGISPSKYKKHSPNADTAP